MNDQLVLECLVCGGGLSTKVTEEKHRYPRYYNYCTQCGVFECMFQSSNELNKCVWELEAFGEKWTLQNISRPETVENFFQAVEEEINEILIEKESENEIDYEYYEVGSIEDLKMLFESLDILLPEPNENKVEQKPMKTNENEYMFKVVPSFLIGDKINIKIPVRRPYQTELFYMQECLCNSESVHLEDKCEDCGGNKIKIIPYTENEIIKFKDAKGEISSVIVTINKCSIDYQYEVLIGEPEPQLFSEKELQKWN